MAYVVMVVVVALSALVMLATVFTALRLAAITGRRLIWGLISLAFVFMVIYRTVTLSNVISNPDFTPILSVELMSLLSAVLLLAGTIALGPLLRRLRGDHEQLKLSEARYRTLTEQSPLSITVYDRNGSLMLANPAFQQLWQIDDKQLQQMLGSYNILNERAMEADGALGTMRQVFEGKAAISPEETETPEGRCYLRHAYPVFGDGGRIEEVVILHQDITERKRAEAELATSRAQLSVLLSNLPGMAYRCRNDRDWTMDFVSRGSKALTGYPPEAIIDNAIISYNSLIHPEDQDMVWKTVQAAVAGKRPFQMTYRIRPMDRPEIWVWEQGQGIFREDGSLDAIEGFVSDITAHKQAEKALMQTETRFRRVLENALDLLYQLNLTDMTYEYVSPAALPVTGYSADELMAMGVKGITGCMHPEDLETVRSHFRKLVRAQLGEEPNPRLVYRWLDKQGKWRWLSETRRLLRNKHGKPVALIGSTRDVTERIQSESELTRIRTYLQSVIDSMPSIIIGISPEGEVTLWNLAASEASSMSSEDVEGKSFAEALPMLKPMEHLIRKAVDEDEPLDGERFTWNGADGDQTIYDLMVYPLAMEELEGAVIRVDDVTTRIQFEEMMVQTEKMMSIGGLAAGMAHEINNPLGGILQACQNIERRTSLALPKNREVAESVGTQIEQIHAYLEAREIYSFLEGIRSDGARAARIVSDMLQYSRRSGSRFAPANVSEVIDTVLRLAGNDYDLKRQYDFRNISIIKDFDPAVPEIRCEKVKIEQVLLNLVKNAAQALSKTAHIRPPEIRIHTHKEGENLRIDVSDNGPGMDGATLRRVFDPFFTTKEVGEGTGLGLSVSYFIITKQHGGAMVADSVHGEGTTFSVRLPIEGKGQEPVEDAGDL